MWIAAACSPPVCTMCLAQSLQPVSHEGLTGHQAAVAFCSLLNDQLWAYYLQNGLLLLWTLLHCFSHYQHTTIYCIYSNSSCLTKQRFRTAPLSCPKPSLTSCTEQRPPGDGKLLLVVRSSWDIREGVSTLNDSGEHFGSPSGST